MKNRKKPQVRQTESLERPSISIRSASSIINEIDKDKALAKEDINKYCRNKAVELLYGCQISGERIVSVNTLETLEVLKFLVTIDGR